MFRRFLDSDNGLMITLAQIGDCVFLSLFWLLGCFPVITIGASTAALYDACYHGFRKREKTSWQQFVRTFRENWKAGILPTAVYLACFIGLVRGMILIWNHTVTGDLSWAVFAGAAVVAALALGILSVLFPMLSRFENSVGALLKNTVLLALANLPRTLGLGIVTMGSVLLCARLIFPLFFLPALTALISALYLEPMFQPYMPEKPGEETEDSEMPLE